MNETQNPHVPVVIVDDEAQLLTSYTMALNLGGFNNIVTCADSRKAMDIVRNRGAAVVLLDLQMPHITGDKLLQQVVLEFPNIPVVVVTGTDRVETGVQCMKSGAFDFLTKPVERDRLVTTVKQALSFAELNTENSSLREQLLTAGLKKPQVFSGIVTNNPKMRAIFQYVEAVAPSSQPVLIAGETGVGKELLARTVHDASGRRGAFVAVNVAGVEESVFSDTLFGHVKGAFTGADTVRGGLVERAAGGTLFLDEISDLSMVLQTKLLRLIQEREYYPLGSDFAKSTDARLVVASNQDLDVLQKAGKFRKDLYYRLSSHRIIIPPLRKRLDDLPLLFDHLLAAAARQLDKKIPHYPKELITLLTSYDYPGNIRELFALVFDALSRHSSGILSMDSFKETILQGDSGASVESREASGSDSPITFGAKLPTMEEAKNHLIEEALKRTGGNKSLAASILGVTRQALNLRERRENRLPSESDD